MDPKIVHLDLHSYKVAVLSVGKFRAQPELNEDRWVITKDTLAVVDGATARLPLQYEGKSGGQFAAQIVCEVLASTNPSLNGVELINRITVYLNERIISAGSAAVVAKKPEARPAALVGVARIVGRELIITTVGDVSLRINGVKLLEDRLKIDDYVAAKRAKAMMQAQQKEPAISNAELLQIGTDAIKQDLAVQASSYYNNPNHKFGHGTIDGRPVPEKFIKVYTYPLNEVETLEIFSDGYFKHGNQPTIESWEQSFEEVEREDPLKWQKYLSTKGTNEERFSDDRTILIACILPIAPDPCQEYNNKTGTEDVKD
jgi:hypothetical protein